MNRSRLSVILLLALAFHSFAAGESPLGQAPSTRTPVREKSPGEALGWSLLGTAAPLAGAVLLSQTGLGDGYGLVPFTVGLGGLVIGPSTGQFYAAAPGQGLLGIGIRGLGAGLGIIGFAKALQGAFGSCGEGDEDRCDDAAAAPLFYTGLFTYIGGTLYSFWDSQAAAKRDNERHGTGGFGLAPTLTPRADGLLDPGVQAWIRF